MKVSLIFRAQRFASFLLKGVGKKEREHYLFTLPGSWLDFVFYMTLANYGWTPNYMGYVYKYQIYQCRRLIGSGKYQYHVRFYEDGTVTGHFEIAPEWDVSDHLTGVSLRTMNKEEMRKLKQQLELGLERQVERRKVYSKHRQAGAEII